MLEESVQIQTDAIKAINFMVFILYGIKKYSASFILSYSNVHFFCYIIWHGHKPTRGDPQIPILQTTTQNRNKEKEDTEWPAWHSTKL